jgi:hypothetical protein
MASYHGRVTGYHWEVTWPQERRCDYDLYNDPVRASVSTATSAMLEAAGISNTADVLQLNKVA